MQIEPLFVGFRWCLVIGVKRSSTNGKKRAQQTVNYDAHWTIKKTWSATDDPMTFDSRKEADIYLHLCRAEMEREYRK